MLKTDKLFLLLALTLCALPGAAEDLIDHYKTSPNMSFSAQRGETLWKGEVTAKDGSQRSCATCHGSDLTKRGKHAKTGEVIEPMAHSANSERFTEPEKVEKWFTRN